VERDIVDFDDIEDEIHCYEKNGVVCPYCRTKWYEKEHDLWEMLPRLEDNYTFVTCINCNKEFQVTCTSIDWWFQSYRLKGNDEKQS